MIFHFIHGDIFIFIHIEIIEASALPPCHVCKTAVLNLFRYLNRPLGGAFERELSLSRSPCIFFFFLKIKSVVPSTLFKSFYPKVQQQNKGIITHISLSE